MKDCTFSPDRETTKRMDKDLSNYESLSQYERLYRNYKERAEKLDN